MHSYQNYYFITKRDREILIEWYVDCLLDHDEPVDTINEWEKYLNTLNNYMLVESCIDFMPNCMEDLQQLHDDYNAYAHDLEKYRELEYEPSSAL